jgi:hypothetical protein
MMISSKPVWFRIPLVISSNCHVVALHSTKNYSEKLYIIRKCHRAQSDDLTWSGASVAPALQDSALTTLLLTARKWKKYKVRTASIAIKFTSHSLKIGQLMPKLKEVKANRQHADVVRLLSFLKKECDVTQLSCLPPLNSTVIMFSRMKYIDLRMATHDSLPSTGEGKKLER